MTASVINILYGWLSRRSRLSRLAERLEKNSEGFPMAFALPQYVEAIKRVTVRGGENVVLKREEREVKGRVFAAFGTPPELGNISEDSASLLRLFRAPLPLRQHCGYNLVLFIPSRMSKYFQPSPALPFPLTFRSPSLSLSPCLFLSVQV